MVSNVGCIVGGTLLAGGSSKSSPRHSVVTMKPQIKTTALKPTTTGPARQTPGPAASQTCHVSPWRPATAPQLPISPAGKAPEGHETPGNTGALEGTRTPNLLIRSQMLYPLSYERLSQKV